MNLKPYFLEARYLTIKIYIKIFKKSLEYNKDVIDE